MLTLKQGNKVVKFARKIAESHVLKKNIAIDKELDPFFYDEMGVFVTIHTYPSHDLRGCIGIPNPVMTLKDALVESSISATRDPRFPPMKNKEFDNVIIEVTLLSKPELIVVENPRFYPKKIKIGLDGLIIEQGFYKGLLLPQVPVEQGWDEEDFLSQTCIKAGLMPDAWVDKNTKIYNFTGQIFTETSPRGLIKEKKINGSDN